MRSFIGKRSIYHGNNQYWFRRAFSGRYRNTSEAVRAGLRLLENEEAEYQAKLETVNRALTEGEDSGESDLNHKQIIAQAKAVLNGR